MNELSWPIRVRYDRELDAAYIYPSDEAGAGGVVETVPVDPLAVHGMINLDFDVDSRLIGVEVLAASKRLPPELLQRRDGRA